MLTNKAFTAESLPQNLRELQAQLNAAIRAHRNLVGRVNLCPDDKGLVARAQAAERLIARIHREQKPLLERFKRDCRALIAQSAESSRHGFRTGAKTAVTVDEVLEERVRRHFCPTTLEKWGSSVACLSPDKKRKVNFLACFDLVTPKVRDDVTDAKSSPRRRWQLVNPDFALESSTSSAAAAAAATASVAAPAAAEVKPLLQPLQLQFSLGLVGSTVSNGGVGILTRSSRRARRSEDIPQVQHSQQQQQQQQQQLQKRKPQFCCARCHRLMPARPRPFSAISAARDCWCQACVSASLAGVKVAIGLPASPSASASCSRNSSVRSSVSDDSMNLKPSPDQSFDCFLPFKRVRRSVTQKNLRLESLLSRLSKANHGKNSQNNP